MLSEILSPIAKNIRNRAFLPCQTDRIATLPEAQKKPQRIRLLCGLKFYFDSKSLRTILF
jgi:hypothetical protein